MGQITSEDTTANKDAVLDILIELHERAGHWASGDILASADLIGLVQLMRQIEEDPVFKELQPEAFATVNRMYTAVRGHDQFGPLTSKLIERKKLGREQMKAFRDTLLFTAGREN